MSSGKGDRFNVEIAQLQRAERQLGGANGLRLGQMIAEMLVIDGLEVLESEGRASTVTQQPFQTGTIPSRNPHCGIE